MLKCSPLSPIHIEETRTNESKRLGINSPLIHKPSGSPADRLVKRNCANNITDTVSKVYNLSSDSFIEILRSTSSSTLNNSLQNNASSASMTSKAVGNSLNNAADADESTILLNSPISALQDKFVTNSQTAITFTRRTIDSPRRERTRTVTAG